VVTRRALRWGGDRLRGRCSVPGDQDQGLAALQAPCARAL